MTQEEKAKAYDEALERARAMYGVNYTDSYTKANLETIFPELRESESERIRKWIIDELKDSLHEIETMYSGDYDNRDEQDKERQAYLNKALSWLEKQKEPNPALSKEDERIRKKCIELIKRVMPNGNNQSSESKDILDCIVYLEKQKEQKEIPLMNGDADLYFDEWNQQKQNPTKRQCFEEGMRYAERLQKEQKPTDLPAGFYFIDLDGNKYYSKEFRYGDMKVKVGEQKPCGCVNVESEYDKGWRDGHKAGLKDAEMQKPVKWSEEDGKLMRLIISILKDEHAKRFYRSDEMESGVYVEELVDFLENLRPQLKQEWSEKDKKILDDVSHILIGLNYKQIAKDYKQAVEKLIYARPGWKPSEEQMEALRTYIYNPQYSDTTPLPGSDMRVIDIVKQFYEQLLQNL